MPTRCCGVHNVMQKLCYVAGDEGEKLEEQMHPFNELVTRAKICIHNGDKLPEEMRIWKGGPE